MAKAIAKPAISAEQKQKNKKQLRIQIKRHWMLYLFLLPCIVWLLVFCYAPMAGRSYVAKKNAKWFGESAPFEADAENEYITAYKKVHPVEILKGYAIDAMAPGYENYSDFSEWAFDDVKEKEYIERAFFADTEEEARQIILDYQEYLKTNNGGEMEKFLDYMTEQSKTRDDFAY